MDAEAFGASRLDRSTARWQPDVARPDVSEGTLGYRGFIVTLDSADLSLLGRKSAMNARFRVRTGVAGDTDKIAESWLLDTTPQNRVSENVLVAAESGIDKPLNRTALNVVGLDAVGVLAACSIYATSSTDFSFWNSASSHCTENNCYNYASNLRTNSFAQPGRRSGSTFSSLTLTDIGNACKRDGYTAGCSGSSLAISLWIWPKTDFHFYRKTADVGGQSRWCHKPGRTNARNTDNSGHVITAPANADRGNYTTGSVLLYNLGGSADVK